mmetsp:Transcript_159/g.382  ORF Transcript_159/g.382 Transcript_159/m.382 type:complete len:203 (-) Transcript_159:959-1567(-)
MFNVSRIRHSKVYMAKYPAARVPSAAGAQVADSHSQHILLASSTQCVRDVNREGRVAKRVEEQVLSVEPQLAVHVASVKCEGNTPIGTARRRRKGLAVPAHASHSISSVLRAGANRNIERSIACSVAILKRWMVKQASRVVGSALRPHAHSHDVPPGLEQSRGYRVRSEANVVVACRISTARVTEEHPVEVGVIFRRNRSDC